MTRRRTLWGAAIVHRYQVHRLGAFGSEELAAEAYDKAARKLHGSNAKLNFHPDTGEELCGQRVTGPEPPQGRAINPLRNSRSPCIGR